MTVLSTVVRRSAKAAALPAGLVSPRRAGDIVILLYHRLGEGQTEIELPVDAFERHLQTIVAGPGARSLDDALDADGGTVVTFDDGTRDFHEHALPLLVRHRVPAVLYLATGGVSNGRPTIANGLSPAEQLSWSHLAEAVATNLVTIGSHTHTHADLSSASASDVAEELRRSKELIEDKLGVSCRHFAYPWAVASPDAERVVRGFFDSAALDGWRVNRRASIDPYRLSRVPVLRSDGQFFFRAKLRGMLSGEALLYRAAKRGPWRER